MIHYCIGRGGRYDSANGTLAVVHGLLPVGRLMVAARLAFFIFLLFPRAVLRRLKLLGAIAGVVVEDVLGELISRARRRGVGWLKLF